VRSALGIDARARLVVAIGRLHPQKGFDVLVEASTLVQALVPEVSVVVAGEGPERVALELGTRDDRAVHEILSDREFEILKLIARGLSLKDIAERLHISAKTVTTYRARILEKTGLVSNAELTRYMVENNLLD